MRGDVWLLVRTDVRRRWIRLVALTLIVGTAGAFVLTAVTGARRSATAAERLFEATLTWDASMFVDYPFTERAMSDLAGRDDVVAVDAVTWLPVGDASGALDGALIAGLGDDWLRDVYRPLLIAGRLPDPARAEELLVRASEAERLGLRVGDPIRVESWEDLALGIDVEATVVGVHRGPLDLAQPETGATVLATGAFGAPNAALVYELFAGTPEAGLARPIVIVRFAGHVADPTAELVEYSLTIPDARPRVQSRDEYFAPIGQAAGVHEEAFWALALAAGAVNVLLAGAVVGRVARTGSHDGATLHALGLRRRDRELAETTPAAIVVVAATILAVLGAIAASPLVPIGDVRDVEPDPGIWVEWPTLLAAAGVLGLATAAVAMLVVRLQADRAHRRATRVAADLPLPPAVDLGRRLALHGSPLGGLAITAVALGVGLVAAVALYRASLDRLLDTPRLYGSNYDVVIFPDEQGFTNARLDHPAIESAAITRIAQIGLSGQLFEALVVDQIRGEGVGTLTEGRAPAAQDEIAVGDSTARRLAIEVGDRVVVAGSVSRELRVTGLALMPVQGQSAYGDVQWLTPAGAEWIGVAAQEPRLVIGLADDFDVANLRVITSDGFPEPVQAPDDVTNLESTAGIPVALAVFGAGLGVSMLVFCLATTVQRRRRDLAVLRALGLQRYQVRRALFAAAVIIALPGTLLGLVVGLVVGRLYWADVARGVPAVVSTAVPVGSLMIAASASIGIGVLAMSLPAWWAGRQQEARRLHHDLRA